MHVRDRPQPVTVTVDSKFAGWKTLDWPDVGEHKGTIFFRGRKAIRVRQVKAFSTPMAAGDAQLASALKPMTQSALDLFNALTLTVFGQLSGQQDDSSELREHVVGLLFNLGPQLSHVQVSECHLCQLQSGVGTVAAILASSRSHCDASHFISPLFFFFITLCGHLHFALLLWSSRATVTSCIVDPGVRAFVVQPSHDCGCAGHWRWRQG